MSADQGKGSARVAESLADAADRERAATTFDRNVVVTAGAGTGKTTLLVDRLTNLLMKNPDPLKITDIVALTFTNKAANEMRSRLREKLQSYTDAPGPELDDDAFREPHALMGRYRLSMNEVASRARDALIHMERAEIGTVHSFASSLLRLYPIEAGLDPEFRQDDGALFERHFEEEWALWLDDELSERGSRKELWKGVLRKVRLDELRGLALQLCAETVPLNRLHEISTGAAMPAPLEVWLKELEHRAARLAGRHPGDTTQIARLVLAALTVIRKCLASGGIAEGVPEEERSLLAEKSPGKVKGWSGVDFQEAQNLCRVAKRLLGVEDQLTQSVMALLTPFAPACRESFVRQGLISFDGLLVQARDLVRDHPRVREELKGRFKAILVDEFQDTDPIQYEILLFLAEKRGRKAKDWKQVELAPGKLFVVGDPKQSIYGFRRADIEAYLRVVREIIVAQDGVECVLATNFRSHAGILDPVNGIFEPLILPRQGLQPAYAPVHPRPMTGSDGNAEPGPGRLRKVVVRFVKCEEKEANARLARALEADSLAGWLQEEVIGKAIILDKFQQPVVVEPKHVAILLRRLTDVQLYLAALRRRGIRYVVEGEKHFYGTQEIIDAVNLLRAVENPHDRSALVGVLRSPLGGLEDHEIYQLHREGRLDYLSASGSRNVSDQKSAAKVKDLYDVLLRLHTDCRKLPVGEAVSRVFESFPIKILAASSLDGEQAVANLEKICQLAEVMGDEGVGTLKEVIERLERWVREGKEEGEGALAEESFNAVKILSVHKAKGLEFPVVVLAGCQSGIEDRTERQVQCDWSTDLVGIRVGGFRTLASVFLEEKERLRGIEEEKRVLYVAMTRAREHLMISSGPMKKRSGRSFLSMLEEAIGRLSEEEGAPVSVGHGTVYVEAVSQNSSRPEENEKPDQTDWAPADWGAYAKLWHERQNAFAEASHRLLFLSPTLLKQSEAGFVEKVNPSPRSRPDQNSALLIGDLAHRFLQQWDFQERPELLREALESFLERLLDPSSTQDRPGIQRELEEILGSFLSSRAYQELASASILGREMPLLIPWGDQIMQGVIDVAYEKDGLLYLADYKSDRVTTEELATAAKKYEQQARIYSTAAEQSLGRRVAGFKLLFLRIGEALEVEPNPQAVSR